MPRLGTRLLSAFSFWVAGVAFVSGSQVESDLRFLEKSIEFNESISFRTPEPITEICEARIDGRAVRLAPLWPNAAATSSIAFQGRYVGCGKGTWRDFDGKSLEDKIAIMDIASGDRWLRAMELGAKAVVFVANSPFGRIEAESKFLHVPLAFPRFLLRADQSTTTEPSRLLASSGSIRVVCRQRWIERSAEISVGVVRSVQTKTSAAYWILASGPLKSFVPDLPPATNPSVAAMVSIARMAKVANLPFDVKFAVVGGAQNALQGYRELADQVLKSGEPILGVITLDLSSGSDRLGMFSSGELYGARPESREVSRRLASSLRRYADDLAIARKVPSALSAIVDGANESDGKPAKTIAGVKLALGCEPFALAGVPTVSFATIDDARLDADVPAQFLAQRPEASVNLQAQTDFLVSLLKLAFERAGMDEGPFRRSVTLAPASPVRQSLVAGFSVVSGRSVQFEPQRSFLPDSPVADTWIRIRGRRKTFAGVRGDFVDVSDGSGRFEIKGASPLTAIWYSDRVPTELDAFASDRRGTLTMSATRSTGSGVSFQRSFMLASPYTVRTVWKTTGGDSLVRASNPGLDYDPVRDRLVGWAGGPVFTLDPETRTWTMTNAPNAPPRSQNGIFGRWRYVPSLDAFVVVTAIDQNVHFYKP